MLKKNIPKNAMICIKILAELSEVERNILIDRFYKEKSLKEVAINLNLTDSAIKIKEDKCVKKINNTFDYYEFNNYKTISGSTKTV